MEKIDTAAYIIASMFHFRLIITTEHIHVVVVSLTSIGFCQQHTVSATSTLNAKQLTTKQSLTTMLLTISNVSLVLRIKNQRLHL